MRDARRPDRYDSCMPPFILASPATQSHFEHRCGTFEIRCAQVTMPIDPKHGILREGRQHLSLIERIYDILKPCDILKPFPNIWPCNSLTGGT